MSLHALPPAERSATPSREGERFDYFARAYALPDGELVYLEQHAEERLEGRIVGQRVRYVDPEGVLIASKEIDFSASDKTAPSFELVDVRLGYREGASRSAEGLELFSGGERVKRSTVDPRPGSVIDAGFHYFVREKLPGLLRGDSYEFDFAVPSLGRYVRFEVERTVDRESRETVDPASDRVRLAMRPASAWVRWLVDPIYLTYSTNGRLLEFEGLSNMKDSAGKTYAARIVFEYPDDVSDLTTGPAADDAGVDTGSPARAELGARAR